MTNIIYVDQDDNVVGAGPIAEADARGVGRRIVRIYIYNSKGEILVQRRSERMQYMPGRWDQSVAGHVDVGEDYEAAAYRELKEELGLSGVALQEVKKIRTQHNGIPEIFIHHMIYKGISDGPFLLDKEEVAEIKWVAPTDLHAWVEKDPEAFTPGFLATYKELQSVV
ncbi:MAG TPA: NUDIX domain-containing protein [Candidatus Paceibacterota bacterium]|nr:NUDIX domain-containing protein [Candidatus Paceibacterota bacterium]